MTDAEISRRLALAIGWASNHIETKWGYGQYVHCYGGESFVMDGCAAWRIFDYRDPAVIWPIAERFDCFPYKVSGSLKWYAKAPFANTGEYADTAAKAVALAVIKSKEQT